MQLGLMANSVGGLGAAIAKEPARFHDLYRRSPRLRQLLGIAEYGAALSDPHAMKAYIETLDPAFWIVRAGAAADPDRAEDMLKLAGYLEESGVHERQKRVFRKLHKDFTVLSAALRKLHEDGGPVGCGALISDRNRDAMGLLHAIRLALIHEIFLLTMKVPEFSSRHGITPHQLVVRILHLDVPAVVALWEEIFPTTHDAIVLEDFGEPADYLPDDSQSYQPENETLFRPIAGLYAVVRRISTATVHRAGFFG